MLVVIFATSAKTAASIPAPNAPFPTFRPACAPTRSIAEKVALFTPTVAGKNSNCPPFLAVKALAALFTIRLVWTYTAISEGLSPNSLIVKSIFTEEPSDLKGAKPTIPTVLAE
jgi:hypothetical protein